VHYSEFQAFELEGPLTPFVAALTSLLTLAALALIATLSVRAWRKPDLDRTAAMGTLAVASVSLVLVTGKTLSPQYVIWLLAVLAAFGAVSPRDRLLPRANALLLLACLLTQLVYPMFYADLVDRGWVTPVVTLALTARNVLLVLLTVHAVRRAWELTSPTVDVRSAAERTAP